MSLAQFSEDPGTGNYSQEILKKFQWAIKRVTNEHSNNKEASLTQDELIQLTGMRHTGPRTTSRIDIPVDSQTEPQTTTVDAHPNVEFHTQSSLLNRIWISINHRWLALYLIEHLFQEDNVPWSYQDSLVYSFQMMAPCGPSCFEYLSPLA